MWRQKATSIVSLRSIVGVVTWNVSVLTTKCIGSTNSIVQLLSVRQCYAPLIYTPQHPTTIVSWLQKYEIELSSQDSSCGANSICKCSGDRCQYKHDESKKGTGKRDHDGGDTLINQVTKKMKDELRLAINEIKESKKNEVKESEVNDWESMYANRDLHDKSEAERQDN